MTRIIPPILLTLLTINVHSKVKQRSTDRGVLATVLPVPHHHASPPPPMLLLRTREPGIEAEALANQWRTGADTGREPGASHAPSLIHMCTSVTPLELHRHANGGARHNLMHNHSDTPDALRVKFQQ